MWPSVEDFLAEQCGEVMDGSRSEARPASNERNLEVAMARWFTRWFLPEDVSKLRRCRTRDTKDRSDDISREFFP